ncbi:MAG TPA: hypothetical protein DHW81_00555, partial [Nitrospiraceae bacterium]|nr:hypothetical protein [Nitrospiraceae bacterium]
MNIFERTAILAVFIFGGYLYGLKYTLVTEGIVSGLLLGIIAVLVEARLRRVSFGSILGGLLGLSIGLTSANLLLHPFRYAVTDEMRLLSSFVFSAILGYGGLFIGLRRGKNLTIP